MQQYTVQCRRCSQPVHLQVWASGAAASATCCSLTYTLLFPRVPVAAARAWVVGAGGRLLPPVPVTHQAAA